MNARRLLLSAFGIGRSPVAPGTVASVATAVAVFGAEHALGLGLLVAGALVAYGALVTLAWGGAGWDAKDPAWIVTDEVAGQGLASAAALAFGGIVPAALALLLFRVFDVLKPGPVRRLERLPRGLGVLADDLLAGAIAGALVLLIGVAGAFDALRGA